jgi:uncharacterized protein YdaT
MPWTGKTFREKHDKSLTASQSNKAAKIANAMLEGGTPEGEAIATAIKRSKQSVAESLYPEKKADGN